MSHSTSNLIELRQHYQTIVVQSEYQASQAKAQLAHIDALLVNGLLQTQALPPLKTATAPSEPAFPTIAIRSQAEAPAHRPAFERAEAVEEVFAQAQPSSPRAAVPETEPVAQGNRMPRPLLPAYRGLKRLEAIAQVLQSTPSQAMTIDRLIPALFGTLSAAEHKAERLKLKTLLYQGEKLGLWHKGTAPSSYIGGLSETVAKTPSAAVTAAQASTAQVKPLAQKAKTARASHPESTPRRQGSLSLLPAYDGMNKLEAIAQVLTEQSGHVLHQDTLFQLLYGEVSPEILSEESRRMRASLFQGVTKGLWEKASTQPSSYLAKASSGRPPTSTAVAPVPAQGRNQPIASTAAKATAPTKTASRGRTQVLSLPAQYAGLSKIETVAKVLEANHGKAMHMGEIIEHLYGKLSGEDLKAEKVRMKDVMTRGVQRQLWNKAQGAPSSIVAGEPNQTGVAAEKASASAKVTQLKPAIEKKPRKGSAAKATAKPKSKKAEVVALLRKSNIKV
jgi:hypothetical protein